MANSGRLLSHALNKSRLFVVSAGLLMTFEGIFFRRLAALGLACAAWPSAPGLIGLI
jgi:hypothetical protein